MMDYKEMAEHVLRRRDIYNLEKRKQIRKTASILSCFCVVALLGLGGFSAARLAENDTASVDDDILPGDDGISEVSDLIKHPAEEEKYAQSSIRDLFDDKTDNTFESVDPGINVYNEADIAKSDESNHDMPESTGSGTTIDAPVSDIPGDTGALTAYEEVWGGSYMNQDGRWVVWLTHDTPENRQEVFRLNPVLSEDNTVFRTADYSYAYLTDLMARISRAMGTDELPFVTTAALREERNRVEVTMNTDDPESINQVLEYDLLGGAIEISQGTQTNVLVDLIKAPTP